MSVSICIDIWNIYTYKYDIHIIHTYCICVVYMLHSCIVVYVWNVHVLYIKTYMCYIRVVYVLYMCGINKPNSPPNLADWVVFPHQS